MTQRITKLILMPCHIPAKRHMHSSPPNIECAYTNITNHIETNSNTKISKINTKTTKRKNVLLGCRTRTPYSGATIKGALSIALSIALSRFHSRPPYSGAPDGCPFHKPSETVASRTRVPYSVAHRGFPFHCPFQQRLFFIFQSVFLIV